MSAAVSNHHREIKAPYRRHPITVKAYQHMGAVDIFAPDERMELIEGEIIDMAPIGSLHASIVTKLIDILTGKFRGRAIIAAQNPIALGDYSAPQPDLAVLYPSDDYYAEAHPGPQNIFLLIEVADTTATYDREVKIPLYARFGIQEIWLLDLQQKRLEVYHGPEESGYRHVDYYRSGSVSPRSFPDVSIDLERLLA